MKLGRNLAITLVCVILGITIAWQYKSINVIENNASMENKRLEELKDDLIRLQKANSDLRTRLQELQEYNMGFERAMVGNDEAAAILKKELDDARIFAGLVDVKGAGIIVTLDDNQLVTVQEGDIQDIVNELRAAGAQAISVNEERIVAMTEIREAGNYIMINGVQMEAPFVIKAISDPQNLERSLTLINGVLDYLRDLQLKVSIEKKSELTIPKVRDDGTVIRTNLLTPVENKK